MRENDSRSANGGQGLRAVDGSSNDTTHDPVTCTTVDYYITLVLGLVCRLLSIDKLESRFKPVRST
jgi:hypothetical protein